MDNFIDNNSNDNNDAYFDEFIIQKLISKALEARKNSYSPYSNFAVGAALLTDGGNIYPGCNMENAAYTPGICAERSAVYSAVANAERHFKAIAVVGGKAGSEPTDYCFPCGVCRQVLREFCKADFIIITAINENEYSIHTLEELLPNSFGPDDLSSD